MSGDTADFSFSGVLGKPGWRAPVLAAGAAVLWTQQGTTRTARIVALIPGGTAPVDLVPEIRGVKRWRVRFRDPSLGRARDHYLVAKTELRPRLGEIIVYYLPDAQHVRPVRSGS